MRIPFLTREDTPRLRRAEMADAPGMAAIHAEGFAFPWSAGAIESMLAERNVVAHAAEGRGVAGFCLFRCAADEAELLTIAVAKAWRCRGLAGRLLEAGLDEAARRRVREVFLEVEAENAAALKLYARAGFARIGRRPGYYRQSDGSRRDALLMKLDLGARLPPVAVLDG